jgi:hypothetical protein
MLIGEPFLPPFIDPKQLISNRRRITRMLNTHSCFDFKMIPEEKDQLHLFFSCADEPGHLMLSFRYLNGKWQSFDSESLMMDWHHDKWKEGPIKDSLENH